MTTTSSEWRPHAACAGMDPSIWYEPDHAGLATRICARCPVTDACLDDALATDDVYGIRGGLTAAQRHQMRDGERRLTLPRCAHPDGGTNRGYERHRRHREDPCDACRAAHAALNQYYRGVAR